MAQRLTEDIVMWLFLGVFALGVLIGGLFVAYLAVRGMNPQRDWAEREPGEYP